MAFELISEAEYQEIPHYKGMEVVHFGEDDWLVLKREKGRMLLLMKDVLEPGEQYHEEIRAITWEKCTLRKWLNEDFYNTFTPEEQARILETHLKNPGNKKYGTKGGKDTDDKIFLLSLDEAKEYMTKDKRVADAGWWWLRSPGSDQITAAGVDSDGSLDTDGGIVFYGGGSSCFESENIRLCVVRLNERSGGAFAPPFSCNLLAIWVGVWYT